MNKRDLSIFTVETFSYFQIFAHILSFDLPFQSWHCKCLNRNFSFAIFKSILYKAKIGFTYFNLSCHIALNAMNVTFLVSRQTFNWCTFSKNLMMQTLVKDKKGSSIVDLKVSNEVQIFLICSKWISFEWVLWLLRDCKIFCLFFSMAKYIFKGDI